MTQKKLISIVTPCFNEEDNIVELCERIRATMDTLKVKYEYEHIIVDNASTDETVVVSKKLAADNPNIKIIVNTRNFGPVRSSYNVGLIVVLPMP